MSGTCECGLTFATDAADSRGTHCPNCGRRLPRAESSNRSLKHNDAEEEFAQYANDDALTTTSWSIRGIVKDVFGGLLLALGWFFISIGGVILLFGIPAFFVTFDVRFLTRSLFSLIVGILLLKARARLHKPRVPSLLDAPIPTDEESEPVELPVELTEAEIELAFDEAVALEQRGEWPRAISLYEELARRLTGEANAEYALNCANRLRERVDAS